MTHELPPRAEAIRRKLNIHSLRSSQIEPINAALSGKNFLTVLPTGAGKSLCFQLPAFAQHGLTIVISPLLALMRDQVTKLKNRGLNATMFTSAQTERELDKTRMAVVSGRSKLLYLSPEQLAKNSVQFWLSQININRLVVDEAHCISSWGHEFRPQYLEITNWLKKHKAVKVSAFTATATNSVVKDIRDVLFQKRKNTCFMSSPIRKNIDIQFIKKDKPRAQLMNLLDSQKCTVIYCKTRSKCEVIAKAIGPEARYYHAGLDSQERKKNEDDFLTGKLNTIVATTAFGMGIDKANIRCVIHADMPPSIENYVQEIGRAGRDGKASNAYCLYGDEDIEFRHEQIGTNIENPSLRQAQYTRCDEMHNLCESTSPWQSIEDYFTKPLPQISISLENEDTPLYKLKRWRNRHAKEKNCAPHYILSNTILEKIAEVRPTNFDDLAAIRGMGKTRVSKYGSEILAIFSDKSISKSKHELKTSIKGQRSIFDRIRLGAIELRLGENNLDRPLYLSEKVILRIIEKMPRDLSSLARINGMNENKTKRFGEMILLELHK